MSKITWPFKAMVAGSKRLENGDLRISEYEKLRGVIPMLEQLSAAEQKQLHSRTCDIYSSAFWPSNICLQESF